MTLLGVNRSVYFTSKYFSRIMPYRVDIEKPGTRHSSRHPSRLRVEDIETADNQGIGVGQQRKIDLVPAGEVFQDCLTIVADGSDLDSVLFEPLSGILQLHELRFAERSPIGGAHKEKNCSVRSSQLLDGLLMTKLIAQSKRGVFCPTWSPMGGGTACLPDKSSCTFPSARKLTKNRIAEAKFILSPNRKCKCYSCYQSNRRV